MCICELAVVRQGAFAIVALALIFLPAGVFAALYLEDGNYRPLTAFAVGIAAMIFLFVCSLFQFEAGYALVFGVLLLVGALPGFLVGFGVTSDQFRFTCVHPS